MSARRPEPRWRPEKESAFLAIITAAITSTFVARAERERSTADGVEDAELETRVNARFDSISGRFDRLESLLLERRE